MTETKHYGEFVNPPIKSVSCEIRFPTLLKISDSIDEFQVKVRDVLSDYYTQTIPRVFKGGLLDEKWWVFKTIDDALSLKVKNNSIVLSASKYVGFTPFFDIIKDYFETFFNKNKIDKFLRIGLRFINLEDFDDTECNLGILLKYFKLRYFKFNESDAIETFSVRYTIKEGESYMNVGEDYAINPQGKYSYQFDFDSYTDRDVNKSNYLTIIDKLHKNIIMTFENYITDEYRNEILMVKK